MKNKYLVWLYANGLHETVDIKDSYSKIIMDKFVPFQGNEPSVWIRTENYLNSLTILKQMKQI